MQQPITPETILSSNDPGDDMQRRLRYQASYAASLALSLLADDCEFDCLFCEHHEDILVKRKDGKFIGVQVKTQASNEPFKANDEPVIKALKRFIELESQFPESFSSYLLATNCGFGRKNKSNNNLPYLLEVAQSTDPNAVSLNSQLSSFIKKICETTNYQTSLVIKVFSKISLPKNLPHLDNAKLYLIEELSKLPGIRETDYEKLKKAADLLVYKMFGAASLEFSFPQPLYFSLLRNSEDQEVKTIIEGKRITSEIVIETIQEVIEYISSQEAHDPSISIPNNIPRSGVVEFIGRSEELEEIQQKLQSGNRIAVTAIAGMGGVGKTELAIHYSLKHLELQTYSGGICWLYPKRGDIGLQIVEFALTHFKNFHLPEKLKLPGKVEFCWQRWIKGEVLIVVDDVIDYKELKAYLPPEPLSRFKVLITTRERLGVPLARLNLDVLKPRASLILLRSLIGRERLKQEPWIARKLCKWVEYLPLGLELVGRYLAEEEDLSLSEMLRRLERKRLRHIALEKADATMTAQLGVAAAFELSWERLDADTQELGCLISLFALAPIPWSLVEEIAGEQCLLGIAIEGVFIQAIDNKQYTPEDLAEELIQNLKESFEASRSVLVRLHLLKRAGENSYRLHQLVREFFRDKLEKSIESSSLKDLFTTKLVEGSKQIPQVPTHDEITVISPFVPHLEEVVKELFEYVTNEGVILSFNGLFKFYASQGLYQICEVWCHFYLKKSQSRWGTNHPALAIIQNGLASSYQQQGQYDRAETLFIKALKEFKKLVNNEDNYNVATCLDNLGLLYIDSGRYKKAESFLIESLEMRIRLLELNRSELTIDNLLEYANSLNNLGLLYNELCQYEKAEPRLLKAFEIRRKYLRADHPHLAVSINNLGILYFKQGNLDKVESLYLQALEIRKKSLGINHPDVASSLHNLADFYFSQRRFDEAINLWDEALKISSKILGNDHPDTILYCRMLYETENIRNQSSKTVDELFEVVSQISGIQFLTKTRNNNKGFQKKSKQSTNSKRKKDNKKKRIPMVSMFEGRESDVLYTPEFYGRLVPVARRIFSQLGKYIKQRATEGYQTLGKGIVLVEIQNSYEEIGISYLKYDNCIQASKNAPSEMWDGVLFSLEIYNPEDYFIALIVDPLEQPETNTCYYYTLPL
jgi:tetratricopeptide (TPR) repeat protein